jgi:hypothetical protein
MNNAFIATPGPVRRPAPYQIAGFSCKTLSWVGVSPTSRRQAATRHRRAPNSGLPEFGFNEAKVG